MRAVVFATAGHIDHGKTALVAALTGVPGDRLAEEKRRGITIVLGFAPLADPAGELDVSFVDVPGHERLVHTMIAGAGAVDRALLVVAADEGIMPQTREHLDVLELLGVRGGVVALSKVDLIEDGERAARHAALRDALVGGPLEGAEIVPCSAVTGEGIEALRAAVLACARAVRREAETSRPFRLGADRVFTIAGAGTVVTGTVRWGEVTVGAELVVLPGGRRVRVRGVQVHGATREWAGVGERVALSLAGVPLDHVPRGDQLLGPGPWRASTRVLLRLHSLASGPELREGDEILFHLLAGQRRARLERLLPDPLPPGGRGWAILRLARGAFTAPGDRVVLRRPSPAATIAGGVVVDPDPPHVRRRDVTSLGTRPDPSDSPEKALALWVEEAGPAGEEQERLAGRLGVVAAALEAPLGRLLAGGEILAARPSPAIFVTPRWVDAVGSRATAVLEAAGSTGVPTAELAARVLPAPAARLREFYQERWRRAGIVRETGGRTVAGGLAPVEDPLAARIADAYREAGLEAPSPDEMAARLGANPKVVGGLVKYLVDRGRLVRVGGRWILARETVDEIVASVRAWGVESFDVGAFKDRFGLSRKLAIPLLEWLDSGRVTRREGDRRRVLAARVDTSSRG